MKEENINNKKPQLGESEAKSSVELQVGLTPLQLNEIYNGDSFKLIERVPAKTVDLILEDMPYNTTACEWDVKIDLELYWKTRLRILKPAGVIILTCSQPFTTILANSNLEMLKYELVWAKNRSTGIFGANLRPLKRHENILVFYNKQPIYNPQKIQMRELNDRIKYKFNSKEREQTGNAPNMPSYSEYYEPDKLNPISILYFDNDNLHVNNNHHPTQKPVGLFEYLIRTYTNEGDLVFDGFGGSGTTAIAAHKSKRNFIVIEKEKKYFDLAKRRLDNERAQLTML